MTHVQPCIAPPHPPLLEREPVGSPSLGGDFVGPPPSLGGEPSIWPTPKKILDDTIILGTVKYLWLCFVLTCSLLVGCTDRKPSASQAPRTIKLSGPAPQIPIFGFHNIVDLAGADAKSLVAKNSRESYDKPDMAAFMEYLATHNYWLLSTPELYDYFLSVSPQPIPAQYEGQKPVLVTFDDGLTGTHEHILEILQDIEKRHQKKLKVVLFVNSGVMGKQGAEFDHATCEELKVGLEQGYYDLQSHGSTHKNLTKLTPTELEQDLSEAQTILQACTQTLDPDQQVATHIAYPFGAINDSAQAQVAKYYRSGFLYNTKTLDPNTLNDPYLIPRLPVNKTMSVARLKQMAAGQ